MSALLDAVPAELRDLRQWVAWRREMRKGKLTKVPFDPRSSGPASTTDPTTWAILDEALQANDFDGVGFVFTADDPYCGVDLDHSRDPETGAIEFWASGIIQRLSSYTEVSPSGTGFHTIVKATIPKGRHGARIEIYSAGRYFCMTGMHLTGKPQTIEDRQAEIDAILAEEFSAEEPETPRPARPIVTLDDQELLEKARRAKNRDHFTRLYDQGDWSGYKSQSEADQALCNLFAFWTRDSAQMDRLFRSSRLIRDKWDSSRGDGTYGDVTIASALRFVRDFYNPGGNGSGTRASASESYQADGEKPEVPAPTPWRIDLFAVERDGLPPVPWIIPQWITENEIIIVTGGPGDGKTTLCYDLAHSFSIPRDFCGMTPIGGPYSVLIIDEELGEDLSTAMALEAGPANPNLHLSTMRGIGGGTDAGFARFVEEVEHFKPRIVIFDSMTHLIAGVKSENDSVEMAEVFRRLFELRDRYHLTIIIIDHRGKWGRLGIPASSELLDCALRGSIVKSTQANAVFVMIRNDDSSANLIQVRRRRRTGKLLSLQVGYEKIDGRVILSNLGTPEDLLNAEGKAQLWIVDRLLEWGQAPRKQLRETGRLAAYPERTIDRAITSLTKSGRIEKLGAHGSRAPYRLALGAQLGADLALTNERDIARDEE